MGTHRQYLVRDYFESLLIAIFLALFIRSFIFTGYRVPTVSMSPTLIPGDLLFAYRLPFGVKIPFTNLKLMQGEVKRGDVVVFTFPDLPKMPYVKRVVGVQGDRIEIKDGVLLVNGQSAIYSQGQHPVSLNQITSESASEMIETISEQSHSVMVTANSLKSNFGPVIVPPGEVFLIGDNRDVSDDSRYWGSVASNRIEGKALIIWMSLDWKSSEDFGWSSLRTDRIFKLIN